MSHRYYAQMWVESHQALKELFADEMPQMTARPEKDRKVFLQMIASLYVRYLQTFQKLETTYDQMVHPQKRRVVRQVLDGVMGRLMELKNEMVQAEFSEYQYIDDVVQDFKLTPHDLEVPVPKYFLQEREQDLEERRQMLAELLLMAQKKPPTQISSRTMSQEEAVRLIQIAERGRQGRLRSKLMRELQEDEKRKRKSKGVIITDVIRERASIMIQKIWRGFIQRRKTKQAREQEMVFIGMVHDPQLKESSPTKIQTILTEEFRRSMRKEQEVDYQLALSSIKQMLHKDEGPQMQDLMKDQIRQWFIECHDYTGRFPDFPDEIDGGSQLIFAEKTPQQVKEEMKRKEAEKQAKKDKKAKEKKEGKAKGKEKEKKEEDHGLVLGPSKFLPEVTEGDKTYKKIWRNREKSLNLNQSFDAELIKEEKRKEVEQEIRVQVDELMREELQRLKMAVDKDMGVTRKGKAKGKKGKKKGKKGKKEKDLTPNRTLESLIEELVMQGLMKQATDVSISDYKGDYSYLGSTLRMANMEPMPSVIDLRQNITLTAILPLGSVIVHEKAPLVKSILLAGPAGIGKRMLVHAICTESGSNFFDLSPENTVGKYPGKSGLQMLMHMVFKVAKILQPSVVWIGDAEKVFYKKVPKEEKELEPKRLKKDLLKVLKMIKAEHRVLIVGTSEKPYLAEIKSFCKMFQKIFMIPRPDYASRFVTWKELIQNHGGLFTSSLNLSALAKMSDGYCQGAIVQAVQSVLRGRRLSLQATKPLAAAEFLLHLARYDPIFKEEEEILKDWYGKTPLSKKRQKAAQARIETPSKGKEKKGKEKKGAR
uniref:IQ and AAA domain-containing protein 1-like n=1 Tax=Geotrypetes seraphini TaxID=260995 RepID=A0A6P8QME3_GEOSA|nr:IQ and AAA domain-containing protein 1-like [Geotrypetes seraphini]